MTEQSSSDSKPPEYKITAKQLDDYVNTRNASYSDAYGHFEVTPDEVDFTSDYTVPEAPQSPAVVEKSYSKKRPLLEVPKVALEALSPIEPGPSLSLLARAKALDIIMKQFNQESKAQGAYFSLDYNGMQDRYGRDTERVLSNMSAITRRMGAEALQAISTLAQGDSGAPMPSDVDYSGQIESSLRREYGPGNADARKRSKLVTKVYRTAGTTKSKHK